MDLTLSRLIGTLKNTFRIGKVTFDASSLGSARTLIVPDKAGTLALTIDIVTDTVTTVTKSLTIVADWQDTGIASSDLATGTYIVQLYANDIGAGGANYLEYYSGVMSWYDDKTNTSYLLPTDEIALHRAGRSGEGGLYLRTFRVDDGYLKLQIFSNGENTSASNYVFKFRRLI